MKRLLFTCIIIITAFIHGAIAKDSPKKSSSKKVTIPVMIGSVLSVGENKIIDSQTQTEYTVVYKDGAMQSVTVVTPKDKTTTELISRSEKMPDFCPDITLCFVNPYDKRQACVCLPPPQTVRPGQPIKTIWRFASRK